MAPTYTRALAEDVVLGTFSGLHLPIGISCQAAGGNVSPDLIPLYGGRILG